MKIHLILSLMVLVGIYFLVPDFDLQNDDFKAVGFGIFSAFCYATRNIIMKSKINHYDGSLLMVYQLLVITIVLSPFAFVLDSSNVIEYLPANQGPQVTWLVERLPKTHVTISYKTYGLLKERQEKRADQFLKYLETDICRNIQLLA